MIALKRRQKIRKNIIILSFLFLPITYYYFSPYLIIDGASNGIVTGSFIVFFIMFVGSFFIGRLFCGWVCPAGGLQRICMKGNNTYFKVGKRDLVKYILVWIPWITVIIFMFIRAGGIQTVDPLYQTYYGISVQNYQSLMLFLVIIGGIAVISLIAGRRGFCHYVCWMAPFMIIGRKIRNLGKWPSLRLTADASNCIDCKTCSKNCPMSLDVNAMIKNEVMENSECILCGTCVDVCPKNVLHYSFSSGS